MAEQTLIDELRRRKCKACPPGTPALSSHAVADYLGELPGWALSRGAVEKAFSFRNYYETMAFVNAVAFVAHGEDHHPDLEVGYARCTVRYSTHSVGGLSENDFICAAKIDRLAQA